MLNRLASILITLALTGAAGSLRGAVDLASVRRAMQDGLPAVAAVKAERILDRKDLSAEDQAEVATLVAEAWIRAGRPEAALAVVDRVQVPDSDFWHAQALVMKGEPDEAEMFLRRAVEKGEVSARTKLLLAQVQVMRGIDIEARHLLDELVRDEDPWAKREASLMLAEMEMSDGKAAEVLESISSADAEADVEKAFLRARALLALNKSAEARTVLEAMSKVRGGGERLHHAAAVLMAKSLLMDGETVAAQEVLIDFLSATAKCDVWPEAFELLWQTGPQAPGDSLPSVPVGWVATGNVAHKELSSSAEALDQFRGHAMFTVARWLEVCERPQEAVGLYEALLQTLPGSPMESEAIRRVMELHLAMGADDRVLALADLWRGKYDAISASALVDFVSGTIHFVRGDYLRSLERFQEAASLASSLSERRRALFNAAVAAYRVGQAGLYQALLSQLAVAGAGGPEGSTQIAAGSDSGETAQDLELDRALDLASRGDSDAETALRRWIGAADSHARLAEAWIALAELELMKQPVPLEEVRLALKAVDDLPNLQGQASQRLDYAKLWLATEEGDQDKVIELGKAYLQTWPASVLADEVRMKVGEAYYRAENFASARTEFELVARETPHSPYADTALYYAGMSAAGVMTEEGVDQAIGLWEELADRGGELGIAARRQQAVAKRRQGRESDALAVLDKLLTEPKLDPEMRRLITCERAELLLVLGKTEPAALEQCVKALETFVEDPDLPCLWRMRAGFTLAATHREAGRSAEALEACYDAVRSADEDPPISPAEFSWFYKAGFFGVDLLEKTAQWEAAARMAEELAQWNGSRAEDARGRAAKIRLAHFLWDEAEKE